MFFILLAFIRLIWCNFCIFAANYKIMKTKIYILLSLIIIAFTSCDLNSSSNYTPKLGIAASHVNKNDTLNIWMTDEGGTYRMDTIFVGDTIVFKTLLNGMSNNLTNYNILQSDTSEARILYPVASSMDSIISISQSDIANGKLVFLPKAVYVYFPIRYIALKPTSSATIQFTLVSDAVFDNGIGNNTFTLKIKTPIKAAPVSH